MLSKAILYKNDPNPVTTEPTKLEYMTLLLSLPVDGDMIKPLVILPLKTLPLLNQRIHDIYNISGSDSGWITGEILENWIENSFLNEINLRREKCDFRHPVLTVLDNHSSRRSINHEKMWQDHQIKFLFIPPHTSHVIQPLDLYPNVMYK